MRTRKTNFILMLMMIGVVLLSSCNTSASNTNTLPIFIGFYDSYETYEEEDELIENDHVIGKTSAETSRLFNSCNKEIVTYLGNYNVNIEKVEKKLEDINTYVFESSCNGYFSVDGYYLTDTCNIYLNEKILHDVDYLKFVYIHETLHYLGFSDNETTMMQEGMADAITENILGYSYEYSYDEARWLCHQIIIADPSIINYIIEGGDIDDRIDSRLENIPREWSVKKHSIKMSDVLDILLYDIEYKELDFNEYVIFADQCQAIVSCYCNTFDLSEFQKEEIDQYCID